MVSISSLMFTGFLLATSVSTGMAELMDVPLNYAVYNGGTCDGEQIDQGTTKYLAPLEATGSFCENSITSVDSGNGEMVMAEVYTKINVMSCDAYPTTGHVFVDVYLCYDSECGRCDDENGTAGIPAQLILPNYGSTYPDVAQCWGIASSMSTSSQRFDSLSDSGAVNAYWKIYADNSCIGDTIGMKIETGLSQAATPDSGSATTNMSVVATVAMMLVIAASL